MNQRIQDLGIQAGLYVDLNGTPWPRAMSAEECEAAYKKFAEMIVKECASICELNGQSYTHSFTPAKARLAESTSNHCGLMIKKHFGVEE